MRSQVDRYKHYAPNDTDFSVFSSANGMLIPTDTPGARNSDLQGRLEAVRDRLEFAGIASNRAIYDPNNNANEEGLAVMVGGLNTIYNNGPTDIKAGDIVLWDMPELDEVHHQPINRFPGIPREKKLFSTKSYSSKDAIEKIKQKIEAAGLDGDTETDESRAQKLAEVTFRVLHDMQRRVIGKALSTAKRGQPFDILLGRYCA